MSRKAIRQDVAKFTTVKKHNSRICERLSELVANPKILSELSNSIGITTRAVRSWCEGNSRPDIDSLADIANFFNTTVDYLCGRSDVKTIKMDNEEAWKLYGLSTVALDNLINVKEGADFKEYEYMQFAINRLLEEREFYAVFARAIAVYEVCLNAPDELKEFYKWKSMRIFEELLMEFIAENFEYMKWVPGVSKEDLEWLQ